MVCGVRIINPFPRGGSEALLVLENPGMIVTQKFGSVCQLHVESRWTPIVLVCAPFVRKCLSSLACCAV